MSALNLFSGTRARRGATVRSAIVLSLGAWELGCGDATPVAPPPSTHVLTALTISVVGGDSSVAVGQPLYLEVRPLDQYGRSMAVESFYERVSDTTRAVLLPPARFDYGDYVLGAAPGKIVVTATATLHGVTISATRTITVRPSNSGTVEAVRRSKNVWKFAPGTVTITRIAGDAMVTWNLVLGAHSVVWDSQPAGGAVDSVGIVTGAVVMRHFTVAGAYHYHCRVHPDMVGKIVVR
jgi:plastocyanin